MSQFKQNLVSLLLQKRVACHIKGLRDCEWKSWRCASRFQELTNVFHSDKKAFFVCVTLIHQKMKASQSTHFTFEGRKGNFFKLKTDFIGVYPRLDTRTLLSCLQYSTRLSFPAELCMGFLVKHPLLAFFFDDLLGCSCEYLLDLCSRSRDGKRMKEENAFYSISMRLSYVQFRL